MMYPIARRVLLITTILATPALAGSVTAGGWTASWDDALDNVLGLTPLSVGADTVSFNKFAQFTHAPGADGAFEPLVITFQQSSQDAKGSILITQESVINQTGRDWTGFKMLLAPPGATPLRFNDARTFDAADSLSVSPFSGHSLSSNGKELSLFGGNVPSAPAGENVWTPGHASGSLWIDAAPLAEGSRAFELKEVPTGGVAIPLPVGAYPGAVLLAGLLAGNLKKRRAGTQVRSGLR